MRMMRDELDVEGAAEDVQPLTDVLERAVRALDDAVRTGTLPTSWLSREAAVLANRIDVFRRELELRS